MRANATYDDPRRYSDGTVHLFVNGQYAVQGGKVTGTMAGVPVRRGDGRGAAGR
jgi:N-acyl-D-amino-acid deacylase